MRYRGPSSPNLSLASSLAETIFLVISSFVFVVKSQASRRSSLSTPAFWRVGKMSFSYSHLLELTLSSSQISPSRRDSKAGDGWITCPPLATRGPLIATMYLVPYLSEVVGQMMSALLSSPGLLCLNSDE